MREAELIIFTFYIGISNAVIGLLFLSAGKFLYKLNKGLNRWYSTRKMLKTIEYPIETSTWIIKHRKFIGIISLLNFIALLLVAAKYGKRLNIESYLYVCTMLTFVLSFGLLLAPNATVKINSFLNIWVSTRKMTRFLDVPLDTNEWILNRRKIFGAVAILISIIIFIMLPSL